MKALRETARVLLILGLITGTIVWILAVTPAEVTRAIDEQTKVKHWVRDNLADPDAQLMGLGKIYTLGGEHYRVARVRARNAFGGPVINDFILDLMPDGDVIYAWRPQEFFDVKFSAAASDAQGKQWEAIEKLKGDMGFRTLKTLPRPQQVATMATVATDPPNPALQFQTPVTTRLTTEAPVLREQAMERITAADGRSIEARILEILESGVRIERADKNTFLIPWASLGEHDQERLKSRIVSR